MEQSALAAIGAGVFDLDVATGEVVWSELALELLRLPATADLESLMQRIHPREREAVRLGFMRAIFECRGLEATFHLVLEAGDLQRVEFRASVLPDDRGRPARMRGICLPQPALTERQAA